MLQILSLYQFLAKKSQVVDHSDADEKSVP